MNRESGTTYWRGWLVILATLILCIGLGISQASAAFVPVYSTNNNFTMLDPAGATAGGTNDVLFTWDGTLKTAVAVSGQVANATIFSSCPFNGFTWKAHDVAVYGPGTYTVQANCAAKAPACATGTNPITFTVGPDEIGAHVLLDWGTVATNKNIDVVNVWKKSSVFTPDTLWTGACGSNSASMVWDLMSRDAGAGINGYPMVDGGFVGFHANFNMMGPLANRPVDTLLNNFTMIDPAGGLTGGTNDVRFTWDGTMKTAVPVSGGIPNATLTSPCPFSGNNWFAHDVTVYAPGTYTVFTGCTGGNAGCGVGASYTFTVNPNQIGVHMLFNWGSFSSATPCGLTNCDIDVVDVMRPGTFASGVDPTVCTPNPMWTGACGANADTTSWDWMSYDWDADCLNGAAMVDGPFAGFNANFNLMGLPPAGCTPPDCNDNNACTLDVCNGTVCSNTPIVCNDNNACTTDTCNTATGCVFTPIVCNDNNACTSDSCDTATGCVFAPIVCTDNNACTTDTCDTATGCVFTPLVCNDNNLCTTDTCNTATGCVFTPVTCPTGQSCDPADGVCKACTSDAQCNDNNACTTDTCNTATGCVFTPIVCNDNNACTTDTCNTATGCVFTPLVCNDNNACTTDTCNTATGCVFTPLVCNDNNLCTTDTCNTATGCVFTPVTCPTGQSCDPADGVCKGCTTDAQCNDNNACTTDTCNTATGCVFTPIVCNDNNACTTDTCNTATGLCVFTPLVCNDNNACTTNTCNTATGCVFTPLVCNDNNLCTTDTCNTATGCVFTPVTCPTGQSCDPADGVCKGCTTDAQCNDNNACTTDTCNTATGCVFTPIVCNDNNACTTDTCNTATGCVFTPLVCNDNNLCTTDTCNTATGCVFTPVTCPTGQTCNPATGACEPVSNSCQGVQDGTPCDDGNLCTVNDRCDDGVCKGRPKNCHRSDHDKCTIDSCDPETGSCVHTPIPGCQPKRDGHHEQEEG